MRDREQSRIWRFGLWCAAWLVSLSVPLAAATDSARPARPPVCGEVSVVGAPGQEDRPEDVRELQLGLRLLALFPHSLDGRYEPHTREAVRLFQRQHGLPADGVAGPETWRALAQAFEQQASDLIGSQREAARTAPPPEGVPLHPDVKPGGYWAVVDTVRLNLTLYRDGDVQGRWPIAVGKPWTMTPVGEWKIVDKGFAEGVFGTRWIGLDIPFGSYGIHGTDRPWSIGTYASAGCIRMYNHDVERLYDLLPHGTPVTIIGVLPPVAWDTPLGPGSVDFSVPLLQWALRQHGFDPGRADARLGPATMRAIAEAQRVLGLARVPAATPDLFRALGLRE